MEKPPYEDLEFSVGGYTLRGRLFGSANQQNSEFHPLIALHGWLDNCASFSYIAPKLAKANCCLLALDLPGHGRSDHRLGLGAYNIWQDIPEILAVVDQLGWSKFGVVGHSRGAMIATIMAAANPERINFLGLVDGIVPMPLKEIEALEQLRRAITGAQSIKLRPRNTYKTFEAAVKAREQGFVALGKDDAYVLAQRGVVQEGEEFYWTNDKKLLIPSEVKYTDVQIKDMMSNLNLNVQLIIGSDGLVSDFAFVLEWLKEFPKVKIHRLVGGHHLHMSQAAEQVAAIFIKALPHNKSVK